MILGFILSLILTLMAVVCFVYLKSVWIRRFMLLLYLGSVVFVLYPSAGTSLANLFGIGRGVDFVLIVMSIALVNAVLLLARYLFSIQRNVTLMARYIAKRDATTVSDDA